MKTEFNLSEKIKEDEEILKEIELNKIILQRDYDFIQIKDVKEFIKRLKEEFKTPYGTIETTTKDVFEIIDKLAGDKLK